MNFSKIPPSEIVKAARMIRATEAEERRIEVLGGLIEAAELAADARSRERAALTNFKFQPDLLAKAISLVRQSDEDIRNDVITAYHHMLDIMREAPLPGIKPLRIAFDTLAPGARPYLLAPYLNLVIGNSFPRLCLTRSDPYAGRLVYLSPGGPIDPEVWRLRLADISAWLTGTWSVDRVDATTITLIRRASLPPTIPFQRTMLRQGCLFAGIDIRTHKPLHIPFADLSAGTYIPGASGSGKTSALHVLMRSVFANLDLFSAVYLIDGKDGVAMNRYADLHSKIHVLYDDPDVWQLMADLNQVMRDRNAAQREAGIDKATRDFIAVIVDELPTFIAKPVGDSKKEHTVFLDHLQRLAMRGRSAGIRMMFITQTPVAEQIPATLRSNCATTIAFRLPEIAHATGLFGELNATNDPRRLPVGQAVVRLADTGQLYRVQFPFAPLWNPPRRGAS